jgi:hypothetical protein
MRPTGARSRTDGPDGGSRDTSPAGTVSRNLGGIRLLDEKEMDLCCP